MNLDKQKIKQRFTNSLSTYDANASVQKMVGSRLLDMLVSNAGNDFRKVLEIGCGTGVFTKKMVESFQAETFFINDISEGVEPYVKDIFLKRKESELVFMFGDIEELSLPSACDLIVSSSTLQWLRDLEGFIDKSYKSLKQGGTMAFSLYGPDNFKEVAQLGSGLTYLSLDEVSGLLKDNGFEILALDQARIRLNFDSQMDLLKHIKVTGVSGTQNSFGHKPIKQYLHEKIEGEVCLTYHPQYFIAKK